MLNKTMKNFLVLLALLFVSTVCVADVWKDSNEWSAEYEVKYQNWLTSGGFDRRIFSDKSSKYFGVETDCADVVYASRIIFSYENKLLFKVKNPARKGIFSAKYISSRENYFNDIPNEIDRVKAFITKLSVHSGTTVLASEDTYPVAIKDIRPGDIYVTKYQGIRHAYLITKLHSSGIFDFVYSTLPRAVREIKFHRGLPLFSFSEGPWGFRRFKKPDEINLEPELIEGFSTEQYDILSKVGAENILSEISEILKVEDESLEGRLGRLLENICTSMNDREDAVKRSLVYVNSIGGRCLNVSEFHNYSTPGLDARIMKQITIVKNFWQKILFNNYLLNIPKNVEDALNKLIGNIDGVYELECSGMLSPIGPIEFFLSSNVGKISSHPNDTYESRWGFEDSLTKCEKYY